MNQPEKKYIRLLWITGVLTVIVKIVMLCTYEITECDDLWQFYNCLMISKGAVIYKDFACVTTPLFYYIFSIPLFFVKTYSAMKIMQVFLMIPLVLVLYGLVKKLNLCHSLGIILYGIIAICMALFPMEYNALVTILTIALMYLMCRMGERTPSTKEMVLYGFLSSAMILTKQTTGGMIVVVSFLAWLFCSQKESRTIKAVVSYILTGLLCGGTFLVYLFATKSFGDFWDNCFSGAKKFSQNSNLNLIFQVQNTFKDVLVVQLVVVLLAVLVLVLAIRCKDIKLRLTSWIAFAHTVVIYPIPNMKHLELAIIVLLIPLIAFASRKVDLGSETFVKELNAIFYIMVLATVGYTGFMIPKSLQADKIHTTYVSTAVDSKTVQKTNEMVEYVKKNPDKKIYSIEEVYSYVAFAAEQMPEPYFNIYLQGNLGKHSPIEILKQIEGQEETYVYIYHDKKDMFWQTPLEGRDYIETNYSLVEQCGKFDIYQVK